MYRSPGQSFKCGRGFQFVKSIHSEQARIDLIEGAAGRMTPLHEEGLLRRPCERLIDCGGIDASRIVSGSEEVFNDRSESVHMWELLEICPRANWI
jgi:hypothetical protein